VALDEALVAAVARRLRGARRVLWITGAGISADSGLPTYRGIGGLYEDNHTVEGMPIEVALSGDVMRERPELTWKYILQVERACRNAVPNRAHAVIVASESRFEASWTLTQNVDGLHRKAGAENVIDIHGDIYDLYCTACEWTDRPGDFDHLSMPPQCPLCHAAVRPDVVLFGELLPEAKMGILARELERGFDAVLSVGTTSVFPYISQPVLRARMKSALTVEINPGQSEVSDIVEYKLASGAAETLDCLWEKLAQG